MFRTVPNYYPSQIALVNINSPHIGLIINSFAIWLGVDTLTFGDTFSVCKFNYRMLERNDSHQ
jgi:hypothetical protein